MWSEEWCTSSKFFIGGPRVLSCVEWAKRKHIKAEYSTSLPTRHAVLVDMWCQWLSKKLLCKTSQVVVSLTMTSKLIHSVGCLMMMMLATHKQKHFSSGPALSFTFVSVFVFGYLLGLKLPNWLAQKSWFVDGTFRENIHCWAAYNQMTWLDVIIIAATHFFSPQFLFATLVKLKKWLLHLNFFCLLTSLHINTFSCFALTYQSISISAYGLF